MRYRCPNCGHIFLGKRERCPSCNQRFIYPELPEKEEEKVEEPVVKEEEAKKVEQPAPEIKEEPKEEVKPVVKTVYVPISKKGSSVFTGKTIGWIGWKLLGGLVTFITLGICYPVALAWIYKWEVNNTIVDGHHLRFNGSAGSLIGRWILWLLLAIITLGIFALFIPVRIQKWKVARTVIAD